MIERPADSDPDLNVVSDKSLIIFASLLMIIPLAYIFFVPRLPYWLGIICFIIMVVWPIFSSFILALGALGSALSNPQWERTAVGIVEKTYVSTATTSSPSRGHFVILCLTKDGDKIPFDVDKAYARKIGFGDVGVAVHHKDRLLGFWRSKSY